MSKTIFNAETLVCVKIIGLQLCRDIVYLPLKKSFWGNRKEGFYFTFSQYGSPFTQEDLEHGRWFGKEKLFVEDNQAFYFPYVELVFVNKQNRIFEFKTNEEALKYGIEMANKYIKVPIEFQ